MNTRNNPYIGVDLGGTNIESAAVRDGQILALKKIKTLTHKGPEGVIARIEKSIRQVMDSLELAPSDFQAVCIGAPGAVDLETGLVYHAPNLDWNDVPLGAKLQERLGIPVFVDNDVNIGVVGEHIYGAGQGARNMIGVFVGTGIGGGIVINNQLIYGSRGAAGEIGHIVIKPRGRKCGCGKKGCVEAYASKTAMQEMILEAVRKGKESVIAELLKKDDSNPQLTSKMISTALKKKDPVTIKVIEQAQYYLGLLTANLVNTLDPEVVVFGGGMVESLGKKFVKPIAKTARKYFLQSNDADKICIVPADLGDKAGPIGAAVIAQRRLGR